MRILLAVTGIMYIIGFSGMVAYLALIRDNRGLSWEARGLIKVLPALTMATNVFLRIYMPPRPRTRTVVIFFALMGTSFMFHACGDFILVIPDEVFDLRFLFGLLSFFIAHVFGIVALFLPIYQEDAAAVNSPSSSTTAMEVDERQCDDEGARDVVAIAADHIKHTDDDELEARTALQQRKRHKQIGGGVYGWRGAPVRHNMRVSVPFTIAFVIFYIAIIIILFSLSPTLANDIPYNIVVPLYPIPLAMAPVAAASRFDFTHNEEKIVWLITTVGYVLFAVSDSMLGLSAFGVTEETFSYDEGILSTYFLAILCIGAVCEALRRPQRPKIGRAHV